MQKYRKLIKEHFLLTKDTITVFDIAYLKNTKKAKENPDIMMEIESVEKQFRQEFIEYIDSNFMLEFKNSSSLFLNTLTKNDMQFMEL